jgi:hypothetical protein
VYNFQVAREFLKQVYVAERLQPPSLSTVRSVYSTLWANATSPAYLKELVSSGGYAKVGIYAVEAYGIFKVSVPRQYFRLIYLGRYRSLLYRTFCFYYSGLVMNKLTY